MKKIESCFGHPLSRWIYLKIFTFLTVFLISSGLQAQGRLTVQGRVLDSNQQPLTGATVMVVGKVGVGTVADLDGNFSITLEPEDTMLDVAFLGMTTQRVTVRGRTQITVVLTEDERIFDEVVIVGYGQQRRASVVGAITQTTGETLERAGGVTSVASALTGNLPGVITTSSTGMPGADDPQIQIRAASTWNNSAPLILVDGVERELRTVDINSVESISVLKDASATAVFGVQGANGVILITTKRGVEGRATVSAGFNATMKTASKLPGKFDAYDALLFRNRVIEHELATTSDAWPSITPYETIRKYRYPANITEWERFPNVDWQDVLFKEHAMSYSGNVNVSGGTRKVKYFANVDFVNVGDLFEDFYSGRAYDPGFGYNRVNMRTNLDFRLTPSTLFKVNIAGSYGIRKGPWGNLDNPEGVWTNAYTGAPDLFHPQYANGLFGFYGPQQNLMTNSVRNLAISGVEYQTNTTLTTDFVIEQDLDMFIEGLTFRGAVAIDNRFREAGRGVDDRFTEPNVMWVDPVTGTEHFMFARTVWEGFDYPIRIQWTTPAGGVQNWRTFRRADYSTRLNYETTILDRHNITAMGTFERKQQAMGNEVLSVRENWVFRTTYNFDDRFTIEYSGVYNGSERFAADYRFAFFSSGGVSWAISEENFMDQIYFLDLLRLRASYGTIGDDSFITGAYRWLYMDQWDVLGRSAFRETGWDSGFGLTPAYDQSGGIGEWFRQSYLGNPDLQWESVTKANFGIDFGFFGGLVRGNFDIYEDIRDNILVLGTERAIPSYFGASAPVANTGKVQARGYELQLRLNHVLVNGMRFWADFSTTHQRNTVLVADEPGLLPEHMRAAGKMVDQTRTHLDYGFTQSWDELFATTPFESNDNQKLPGDRIILDFNADGIINHLDVVPFSFPTVPQNTYTTTIGWEWRGLSTFVQFYGVSNVTRPIFYTTFANRMNSVFDEGTIWSKDNPNPDVEVPAWQRTPNNAADGAKSQFDASYLRLKNAEIAYTFDGRSSLMQATGLGSLRVFLNGNNLWLWTDMPDDRESNFATENPGAGAYPTVRRFNLGVNVTF